MFIPFILKGPRGQFTLRNWSLWHCLTWNISMWPYFSVDLRISEYWYYKSHPVVTDVLFEFYDSLDNYVFGFSFREDVEWLFLKFPNFVNFTIPTIYLCWITWHPEAVDVFSKIFQFPIKSFQIGSYSTELCSLAYCDDRDSINERHQYRRERNPIYYGDRGLESVIKVSSKFSQIFLN